MRPTRSGLLLVAVLAALLVPWPHQQRFAHSQGLDVSNDVLGSGAVATAAEFNVFEDVLSLANSNLGGRGRGGRGGTGNLGGGSFRSEEEFERLQTSMYYIGGSLDKFNARDNATLAQDVEDQGLICNSCVGHAIAAAIKMSLAYNLKDYVDDLKTTFGSLADFYLNGTQYNIDYQSLYYCTQGGRTCKTGWDILDALEKIEAAPWLIRPGVCMDGAEKRDTVKETDRDNWVGVCSDAKQLAIGPELGQVNVSADCLNITEKHYPWTCEYTSLSTFWQIQRFIRNYGSVITRIWIPDDFDLFLNETAKNFTGEQWRPYTFNKTSKPLFGHAAIIVGYNNKDFTWTVQNSWGFADNPNTSANRPKGITKDGTFRVQMGLLGIGTPEATYGVRCFPKEGGQLDRGGQPPAWKKSFTKNWQYVPGSEDKINGCVIAYFDLQNFRFNSGGLASVVDLKGFDSSIPIVPFVQENYQIMGFLVKNFTYKYPYKMNAKQLENVWQVVRSKTSTIRNNEARGFSYKYGNQVNINIAPRNLTWHRFECSYFNEKGEEAYPFSCPRNFNDSSFQPESVSVKDFEECGKNGTVGCTLFYWDVDVTNVTRPDLQVFVRVCNKQWLKEQPAFSSLKSSASEKTGDPNDANDTNFGDRKHLQDVLDNIDQDWRNSAPGTRRQAQNTTEWEIALTRCTKQKSTIDKTIQTASRTIQWYVQCNSSTLRVTKLRFRVSSSTLSIQNAHPKLNAIMDYALGSLDQLQDLDILVFDGFFSQMNLLTNLVNVSIYHVCMSDTLPVEWIPEFRELRKLRITPDAALQRDFLAINQGTLCGFMGDIPDAWSTYYAVPIEELDLSGNRISGPLPDDLITNWGKLKSLQLQGNDISGTVPSSWSRNNATSLRMNLRSNDLKGTFPTSWTTFNGRLKELNLDGNTALSGCVPLNATTNITAQSTSLTDAGDGSGRCPAEHESQVAAMNANLTKCLADFGARKRQQRQSNPASAYTAMLTKLLSTIQGLGSLVPAGATSIQFEQTHASGKTSGEVRVVIEKLSSVEYITQIYATRAGLNLGIIPFLFKGLPKLRAFICENCNGSSSTAKLDLRLLASLPAGAPALQALVMYQSNIVGSLPASWQAWSSLQYLNLTGNKLTGQLPDAYGAASSNMRNDVVFTLSNNTKLTGPVPESWSYFGKGLLDVRSTNISGCTPDGLPVLVDSFTYYCADNSSAVQVLKDLKQLLESYGGKSTELDKWTIDSAIGTGGANPYKYCLWPGISCDVTDKSMVTGLSLTNLNLRFTVSGPPLQSLIAKIIPLGNLSSLVLASMSLTGGLPANVVSFELLQEFDISGNDKLNGPLPDEWAGLSELKVLDISGTGITGQLPDLYAAMMQLETFKASNCAGLSGILPRAYALLKNMKVFEVTGSNITDTLPDWLNVVENSKAGAAAVAKANSIAASASAMATQALADIESLRGDQASAISTAAATVSPLQAAVRTYNTLQAQAIAANRAASILKSLLASGSFGPKQLTELRLANNRFKGYLPDSYSGYGQLQVIDLSYNADLVGGIPTTWGSLDNLQELNLAANYLTGYLPIAFTRLTQLTLLDVSNNYLSGYLPDEYVSLKNLQRLDVSTNGFTGSVPALWQQFGYRSYKMDCLLLYNNDGLNKTSVTDSGAKNSLKVIITSADTRCGETTAPRPKPSPAPTASPSPAPTPSPSPAPYVNVLSPSPAPLNVSSPAPYLQPTPSPSPGP